MRSEEHTSELQSPCNLVCRLLLEKKKKKKQSNNRPTHPNVEGQALHHTLLCRLLCTHASCWLPLTRFFFFCCFFFFFFFNDTATTEIYTLSLHDALPI